MPTEAEERDPDYCFIHRTVEPHEPAEPIPFPDEAR